MVFSLTKSGEVATKRQRQLTDHLWGLRKRPFWEAVENVVKIWKSSKPSEWDAYIVRLESVKQSQKKKSGIGGKEWRGVSVDKRSGLTRKHVVDFPIWIHLCLKKMYPEKNEYLNGKKFFRSFGARFPVFRVFEKV